MARKKKHAHGGHGWFVTFADLMGLLMSFFVMVAAYSTMDQARLRALVGSMREAFGNTREQRMSGVVELGGVPTRNHFSATTPVPNEETSYTSSRDVTPGVMATARPGNSTVSDTDMRFSTSAASLRQAWQQHPELAALSQNLTIEETREGLAIQLADQDGRAMFPEGSRYPYERTRVALQLLAPLLSRLPNQVQITGHTAARRPSRPGITNWDLSADRANTVRQILMESGLPSERISGVTGRAEADPLMASNPTATPNSRVTIVLLHQAPPVPLGHRP